MHSPVDGEDSYKVSKLYNYEQDLSSDYSSDGERNTQEKLQAETGNLNEFEKVFEEKQSEGGHANDASLSLQKDKDYGISLEKFSMEKDSSEEEDEILGYEKYEPTKTTSTFRSSDAEKLLYQEVNNETAIQKAQELVLKEQNYLRGRAKNKRSQRMQLNLQQTLTQFSFFFLNDQGTILQTFGKFNDLKKQLQKEKPEEVQYVVNAINYVTSLIDLAQSKGFENNLYDIQLHQLLKCIDEETIDELEKIAYRKTKLWSFKKIAASDNAQHHGHTTYEMDYWNQNYFKNKVAVKFSNMPDTPSNWLHILCINFARK
ncbi:hypothetical protein ACO0RG_001720 [Hanseniaspora osmophila]